MNLGLRLVAWVILSVVGSLAGLAITFAVFTVIKDNIAIPDDSWRERFAVLGFYGLWFILTIVAAVVAWRWTYHRR